MDRMQKEQSQGGEGEERRLTGSPQAVGWRVEDGGHLQGDAPADIGARVTFEWLPGERFLIQRWEISLPEGPDGIAIIGPDPEREGSYLQHYFDTRGVARVYKMSFENGIWSLCRDEADFSPLDFSQRYSGTFSDDGKTIAGAWEICYDGKTWEHDFDLSYTKP